MATRSEENRRKQQALINAGYRGVVADGSWGPYQQKLYLHYLANSLGPTKQQKVNTAKQNNQREAQIAKNYFSQTPSVGNLARGVYHWWNSNFYWIYWNHYFFNFNEMIFKGKFFG